MDKWLAIAGSVVVAITLVAGGTARPAKGAGHDAGELPARTVNGPTAQAPTANGDSPSGDRQYKGWLDPIGPFDWRDLDGHRWNERTFRGKVLIVQLWAAWCGPCVAEFPAVQKLYDSVRHDPSIAFVSLNLDRDPTTISAFLLGFRNQYSFPVLFAGAQLRIKSLPLTWIVDRDGYIRDGFGNSGVELSERARALAEAVKRRPPVAALPREVLEEKRKQNEREAANSR